MSKFTGWLMVILCSGFLLTLGGTFVMIAFNFNSEGFSQMTTKEIISIAVSSIVVTILLIAGLRSGLKKIKKEKAIPIIDYTDVLDIKLTGKMSSYKDYRNLNLELAFKKPIWLTLLVSLTFLLVVDIINNNASTLIVLIVSIGFLLLYPIFLLRQVKKNYKTNKIFQEQLNYQLTNDSIQIRGETFDSVQKWTGFYKIKETKVFFLFYRGEGAATFLDKRMFTDTELTNFKQFIRSLNIKYSN